ncbi:MAG TPA: phosphatase PAP2 family protein [Anaerolineales bacterium]|nr:phosphatase PAP2 family protein [Anaerolineales bacterium]
MSFQSDLSEPTERLEASLTLTKRIILIALACCIQMIYIPASNRLAGGIEPKLPIDILPIWPVWVLPYVLCYILWFASMTWVLLKMEDRLFRAFVAACMLTFGLGALTFVLFPTYVKAATLEGGDIFTVLLRYIHETWGRYAALPSGHVYITTLFALFFSRWYPHHRMAWGLILIMVSLSTLFTGQHYILDVIGGLLVALAGYHVGLWWTGFYSPVKQSDKRSGRRVPSSSMN